MEEIFAFHNLKNLELLKLLNTKTGSLNCFKKVMT